ncbi:MAG: 4-hydroxy-3-methylbut-2-enyl diphosphate reductase, partial [Gammaproteobacteria bacterium]
PALSGPRKEDICYATQNRQDAVKSLVRQCNVILVVGSPNSSNSNRLREIAEKNGKIGHLIDGPDDLQREWFSENDIIGVTAGASAPELLVRQVIDRLMEWGGKTATEQKGREEHVVFTLPKVLRTN